MLGIKPIDQRRMMDESLEAIMALLECEEPVTRKTDWFEMNEARLHLRPYSNPRLHVAVASTFSPAGMTAAGKYGCGVLSVGTTQAGGLINLKEQWAMAEEAADKAGKEVKRSEWRLVQPFYLAEDRDQAFEECRAGARSFNQDYFEDTLGRPPMPESEDIALQVKAGGAIVGTPDDAIEAIERLQDLSGGFGGLMFMAHEWVSREKIHKSYELMARYVMPKFQGQLAPIVDSQQWVANNRETIFGTTPAAMLKAFADAGKEIPPEMAERMQR
jgi:limonene 1,2-monooxygenase